MSFGDLLVVLKATNTNQRAAQFVQFLQFSTEPLPYIFVRTTGLFIPRLPPGELCFDVDQQTNYLKFFLKSLRLACYFDRRCISLTAKREFESFQVAEAICKSFDLIRFMNFA